MAATTEAHRFIFCINSGRSGSQYLSTVLGSAQQVLSFHEADPKMIGEHLYGINHHPYETTFQSRQMKVAAIQSLLTEAPDKRVYCETSHMFIKTFFDVVVDAFGTQIQVVLLRRRLAAVLKSFLELGYFSDKNQVWSKWMSSPNAATAAIPCIDTDDRLDDCDRAIAYLIDIEARAQRFMATYPQITVHPVRLESFNTYDFVVQFFQQLQLEPTSETQQLYSQVINVRKKRKQQICNPVNLDYCQSRIEQYLERATSQGIQWPRTLALK